MGVFLCTAELAAEFLDDCQGLARATITGYGWALARLERHCPSLPPERRELRRLLADSGLAAESRKDLRVRLGTFFRWALAEGYLAENPLAGVGRSLSKRERRLPRVFSDVEITAIQAAALAERPAWLARRNHALIGLPLLTGLRLGELAGLEQARVFPESLRVFGKTGERVVPLCPEGRRLLLGVGDERSLWLAGSGRPLTRSGVELAIRRVVMRAGVQGDKLGPHTLRHTFATNFIRDGGRITSLQRILGHADLATTMIYVHLAGEDVQEDYLAHSPARRLVSLETLRRAASG